MNPIQLSGVTGINDHTVQGKTQPGASSGARAQSQTTGVGQEQVTLSSAAHSLNSGQSQGVDGARIEALRAAVAAGTYTIVPQHISQGLQQDQQQLQAKPEGKA